MKTGVRAVAAALLIAGVHGAAAGAQTFPTKPVKLVVPFAPGGTSDIVARSLGQKLGERWSQTVIVENKPGAATTLAAEQVAKAPADGYTILLAPAPFVIAQYAYPKLGYDTRRDFTPVTLLVTSPLVVTVSSGGPLKTMDAFLAYLKAHPGKLNYGSPGNGSLPHLAIELFKLRSNTDIVHVPYRGGGPAVVDLVGGRIDLLFASMPEVQAHVQSGKLKVIGVTSPQRAPAMPDVPTVVEKGLQGYEAFAWFGVVAPAGVPRDLLGKISGDMVAALTADDVRARLTEAGMDVAGTTPEEFGAFLDREHARWSEVVRTVNIRIE
jgi:tripartite-type tricarboxylate transporter receptor subunit TctC